jgi:HEXXH motif-containing protein
VTPLVENASLRVATPLRLDPRPVAGLMHQAWVLLHLAELYDAMASLDHPVVRHNLAKVIERGKFHGSCLKDSLRTLEGNSHVLTSAGEAALNAMTNRAG